MVKKTIYLNFYVFLGLIILVNISLALYSASNLRKTLYTQGESDLEQTAGLLSNIFSTLYSSKPEEADRFCKTIGRESQTRITLILPDGKVIGDSQADISLMNNHTDRPEFQRALLGDSAFSVRFSYTLNKEMLYLALPVYEGDKIQMILRTALPLMGVERVIQGQYLTFLFVSLLSLLFTILWSYSIFLKILRPLKRLSLQAEAYAGGDFSSKGLEDEAKEFLDFSQTLEKMAEELRKKMSALTEQKDELSAILSSMVDAVILLDDQGIIKELNPAALRLLKTETDKAVQHSLLETFRNTELEGLSRIVLASGKPVEREIILPGYPKTHLQVHLSRIKGDKILLVLHDISRIKHLEEVRKDFVANVSHELKTPITSIKGFVETLYEGALEEKETARHFLQIIGKQADQIAAIIEDLLILSRLEQGEGKRLETEPCNLSEIIDSALQVVANKAQGKGILLICSKDDTLTIPANPVLMEQALVNLLDNAIKYSPKESEVTLGVQKEREKVKITIKDKGCGIPEKDLPRIFERFYRVDKARSRDLGGTGLGLAIVKHILLLHNGEIFVESSPGEGSRFTIILPLF